MKSILQIFDVLASYLISVSMFRNLWKKHKKTFKQFTLIYRFKYHQSGNSRINFQITWNFEFIEYRSIRIFNSPAHTKTEYKMLTNRLPELNYTSIWAINISTLPCKSILTLKAWLCRRTTIFKAFAICQFYSDLIGW